MEQEKKKSKLMIIIPIAIVILAVIGIIVMMYKDKGTPGETKQESKIPEITYKVGDTVKTDIAEFTLNDSQLTIALSNKNDETYYTPKEYNAEQDTRNPYVAGTGHTLVYVDFTLSAIDRSDINTNDSFRGSLYEIMYNENKFSGNFKIGLERVNAGNWKRYTYNNILISKGNKSQFRGYANISVNVDNLKDKYYITFNLPNSKGEKEKFTYIVNE